MGAVITITFDMTDSVTSILNSFSSLSESEQYLVASELLKRLSLAESGDIPDASLVSLADDVFLSFEVDEISNAQT